MIDTYVSPGPLRSYSIKIKLLSKKDVEVIKRVKVNDTAKVVFKDEDAWLWSLKQKKYTKEISER